MALQRSATVMALFVSRWQPPPNIENIVEAELNELMSDLGKFYRSTLRRGTTASSHEPSFSKR